MGALYARVLWNTKAAVKSAAPKCDDYIAAKTAKEKQIRDKQAKIFACESLDFSQERLEMTVP